MSYLRADGEREHCGTTVTLHLKPENAADGLREKRESKKAPNGFVPPPVTDPCF